MLAPIAIGFLLLAHPPDAPKAESSCCDDKPVLLAMAAKCTGSASCRACSNCSRCAYCKGGGSCGACSSSRSPAMPDEKPFTPAAKPSFDPEMERKAAEAEAEREREAAKAAEERSRLAAEKRAKRDVEQSLADEAERRRIAEAVRESAEKRAASQLPLGRTLESKGNKAGAMDVYRRIVADWPETAAAVKAALRIATLSPSYEVARVVDGDTIVVLMDGKQRTVRLIGVDTPEAVHPQKPVERFGREASDFLKGLLRGQSVRLEYDPISNRQDRYGRLLAYAYLADGRFVNREIIASGYGFAYTKYPCRHLEEFRAVEARSRMTKVGMWADEASGTRGK
jgi:endonuclease YncB( thermonuclease family)